VATVAVVVLNLILGGTIGSDGGAAEGGIGAEIAENGIGGNSALAGAAAYEEMPFICGWQMS